ncbi:MAG TPA: DUF3800 domain-containing protein [Chloroflexota bacterium]|nr:DUF3800 domain-containing protein [Chloroflexota bacterium]
MSGKDRRLLQEGAVNFCYCDESGTGEEPIATMAGIVVDAGRMHLTKADWRDLLERLRERTSRHIDELHTADFYAGNGVWRGMNGPDRAFVINEIFEWLAKRKHHIVYASVNKACYGKARQQNGIPDGLGTVWRFLGFHLVLAIQRYSQPEKKRKGNTYLVFDNEEQEHLRFPELILTPPAWSDEYYGRDKKDEALSEIVDVPVFGDSKTLPLLQVADLVAFFLRRYAEMQESLLPAKYNGEKDKVSGWVRQIQARSIGRAHIYPKSKRNSAQDLFYQMAPPSLRDL